MINIIKNQVGNLYLTALKELNIKLQFCVLIDYVSGCKDVEFTFFVITFETMNILLMQYL